MTEEQNLNAMAQRILDNCDRDGIRVIALLLKGRMLVDDFMRSPGVTPDQCRDYIRKVDDLVFGDDL